MDWSKWLFIDWQVALAVVLSAVVVYSALILYTRLMGLRSFAKLSSYDFAMTVAMGSILASTVLSKSPALLKGLLAIATLFILQATISVLRRKSKGLHWLVDNQAIVLMAQGEFIWENIREAKLSKSDIQEVLRKNGIKSKSEVFAMVMETTGDMSVIKSDDTQPDIEIFEDIRDYELLINDDRFNKVLTPNPDLVTSQSPVASAKPPSSVSSPHISKKSDDTIHNRPDKSGL